MLYDLTDASQCAKLVASARPRKASQEAMLEVIRRIGKQAPTPERGEILAVLKKAEKNEIAH